MHVGIVGLAIYPRKIDIILILINYVKDVIAGGELLEMLSKIAFN